MGHWFSYRPTELLSSRERGVRGRRDTRETGDRENDTTRDAKLRKTVLALLKRCQVSKAVRGLCSHSLASQDDPKY